MATTHHTDSETATATVERDKAWHLLAILLSIGRPTRSLELASRCTLFSASPDLVEFLCSIPESPLLFSKDDHLVTISSIAISLLGEFVSKVVDDPDHPLRVSSTNMKWRDAVKNYYSRKRKGKGDQTLPPTAKKRKWENNTTENPVSNEVHANIANDAIRNMSLLTGAISTINPDRQISSQEVSLTPLALLLESKDFTPSNGLINIEDANKVPDEIVHREFAGNLNVEHQPGTVGTSIDLNLPVPSASQSDCESTLRNKLESSVLHKETTNKMCATAMTCQKAEVQDCSSPSKASPSLKDPITMDNHNTHQMHLTKTNLGLHPTISIFEPSSPINHDDKMTTLGKDLRTAKVEDPIVLPSAKPSTSKRRPQKSSTMLMTLHQTSSPPGQQVPSKLLDSPKKNDDTKQDQKCISIKEKSKQKVVITKESKLDSTSIDPNKHIESKSLPDFESFIIEEEEGSGGYGTVYRAKRKDDAKTFAIKCPHPKAHIHHVHNELKMLERFGGRNFVIKYEGSFNSGNSECFILEHVEHDRPEVLKREINIFELRWYGYCMFRALSSLHQQGIVHRDVKPGNFLFSRKLNKGYLIDFNLATDLHQKYGSTSKSKSRNTSFNHVPVPTTKSLPPNEIKAISSRLLDAANREAVNSSKLSLQPKNMKKRANATQSKAQPDLGSGNIFKSQGADGSGITSAKDVTSTRTHSAERLRERIFCRIGRKELMNLAIEGAEHKAVNVPASQSKRIAAPPGKNDRKSIHFTPMPLRSSGAAVSGAGLLKQKGDGKHKKEGPCVGTKGFRAPEVLFRSPHQGAKLDVWSAGVTLLYLIIGKTPFVGDPEQNVKDIAKLRGSEDLWEVAKLHNRESSFPEELYDIQSLPSLKLEKWCKLNTRRPDFLEFIPESLFDLIDKCLTVNPRLRISADEALKHEFFFKCHEELKKQRRQRQGSSTDTGSAVLQKEACNETC